MELNSLQKKGIGLIELVVFFGGIVGIFIIEKKIFRPESRFGVHRTYPNVPVVQDNVLTRPQGGTRRKRSRKNIITNYVRNE